MPRSLRWSPPDEPFTLDDVAPLGVTRAMVRNAERLERIKRLSRGVYVATGTGTPEPAAWHLLQARAVQLGSSQLVASDGTAALAWDVPTRDRWATADAQPRFTIEPGPSRRSLRSDSHIVKVRRLPAEHRTTHPSGLVVTTIPRTAIDLAARTDLSGGLMALDAGARLAIAERVGARRLRDATADPRVRARAIAELRAVASVAANRLDRPRLERALALADPRREAPSESAAFALMIESGLPAPEPQVRIDTEVGVAWPDFLFPEAMVIVEVDGKEKYRSDPEALVREKLRQEALEKLGYVVVRWMAEDIWRKPEELVARLWRILSARGAV